MRRRCKRVREEHEARFALRRAAHRLETEWYPIDRRRGATAVMIVALEKLFRAAPPPTTRGPDGRGPGHFFNDTIAPVYAHGRQRSQPLEWL